MKTALLVTAMLAFGAVSANASNDHHHASSLYKGRHRIESAVMAVGVPAVGVPTGGSIDDRPASTLYRQNMIDSGYDAKKDFDRSGTMCARCDFDGN